MRPKLQSIALTGLRLALAIAFLSSVAGRFELSGKYGSGWVKFVAYAGSVNWYLPDTFRIVDYGFGIRRVALIMAEPLKA